METFTDDDIPLPAPEFRDIIRDNWAVKLEQARKRLGELWKQGASPEIEEPFRSLALHYFDYGSGKFYEAVWQGQINQKTGKSIYTPRECPFREIAELIDSLEIIIAKYE